MKETYVTLRSDEIPLQIEGGTAPAATPDGDHRAGCEQRSVRRVAATPPPEQAGDILPQLDDRTKGHQTFQPLYEQRVFWLAQLVPLFALARVSGMEMAAGAR